MVTTKVCNSCRRYFLIARFKSETLSVFEMRVCKFFCVDGQTDKPYGIYSVQIMDTVQSVQLFITTLGESTLSVLKGVNFTVETSG